METTLNKLSRFHLSTKTKETIVDYICYALIVLFIYTAASKIQTYHVFQKGLSNSVLLKSYSTTLAWLIPTVEILICILLIIPMMRWYGLIASLLIMIVFTSYLIYMVTYGGPKSCGCGGVIESMSWAQHIYFNFVFIGLSAIGVILNKNQSKSS